MATIRVSEKTRATLRALEAAGGESINEVAEKAVELFRRQHFWRPRTPPMPRRAAIRRPGRSSKPSAARWMARSLMGWRPISAGQSVAGRNLGGLILTPGVGMSKQGSGRS